jgi:hypothetical protein
MLALKRFVTVVVMVYLLLALLFFLVPSVRATVAGFSPSLSAMEQERQFFYWLAAIGAIILALHLLTENADSAMLRRQVAQHEGKVNELKARLYDNQQQTVRPASTVPRPVEVAPSPGSGFTISANPDAIPRTNPYAAAPNEPTGADGFSEEADRPVFPQSDPSLSNTPPADRPRL